MYLNQYWFNLCICGVDRHLRIEFFSFWIVLLTKNDFQSRKHKCRLKFELFPQVEKDRNLFLIKVEICYWMLHIGMKYLIGKSRSVFTGTWNMLLSVAYGNEIFDWEIKNCFYWDSKYFTQVYIYIYMLNKNLIENPQNVKFKNRSGP